MTAARTCCGDREKAPLKTPTHLITISQHEPQCSPPSDTQAVGTWQCSQHSCWHLTSTKMLLETSGPMKPKGKLPSESTVFLTDVLRHWDIARKKPRLNFSIYSQSIKKVFMQCSLQVESMMTVLCWKRFWLVYSKKLILHEKHLNKSEIQEHIFVC